MSVKTDKEGVGKTGKNAWSALFLPSVIVILFITGLSFFNYSVQTSIFRGNIISYFGGQNSVIGKGMEHPGYCAAVLDKGFSTSTNAVVCIFGYDTTNRFHVQRLEVHGIGTIIPTEVTIHFGGEGRCQSFKYCIEIVSGLYNPKFHLKRNKREEFIGSHTWSGIIIIPANEWSKLLMFKEEVYCISSHGRQNVCFKLQTSVNNKVQYYNFIRESNVNLQTSFP